MGFSAGLAETDGLEESLDIGFSKGLEEIEEVEESLVEVVEGLEGDLVVAVAGL